MDGIQNMYLSVSKQNKKGLVLSQKLWNYSLLNHSSKLELYTRGIENRIYREEFKESLGMNFFSPFQPVRELKVYKSCKCSQIICSRVH